MRLGLALVAVLLSLSLAGCQEVTLVDDVDLALDWDPLTGPSDALHTPYVLGASFGVWVNTTKKQRLTGWRIESADEGVMTLGAAMLTEDEQALHAAASAMAVGSVELRILDEGGEVRHRHTVDVRFPDRVDVLPHGPLLIGREDVVSEEHPLLLQNGTTTFLVQYYAGGDQLAGHGALAVAEVALPGSLNAHTEKTSFLEDRDWLVVGGAALPGTGDVSLTVAGQSARSLSVDTVAESAIDHMTLTGESEDHAHKGDSRVVLAEAFDAAGRTIYGTEFQFTANEQPQTGYGDLYRYMYDGGLPVMLEASHGQHVDGVLIHSSGGFVDSTNRLGCSSVPGAASGSAGALFAAAAVLLLRRRRMV